MQYEYMAAHSDGALQFSAQERYRQLVDIRFYRICQIDNIRCMYDKFFNAIFTHQIPCGWDIQF